MVFVWFCMVLHGFTWFLYGFIWFYMFLNGFTVILAWWFCMVFFFGGSHFDLHPSVEVAVIISNALVMGVSTDVDSESTAWDVTEVDFWAERSGFSRYFWGICWLSWNYIMISWKMCTHHMNINIYIYMCESYGIWLADSIGN